MKKKLKPDFCGYATKHGVKCTDGRTITSNAFVDDDGKKVPLLWHHLCDDPDNVLGYAILEHRNDGVYARCTFNDTPKAKQAKALVQHGDIDSMSIRASELVQKGGQVLHGQILEVSLVTAGANKGAKIDNVSLVHGDSCTPLDDEAIMFFGSELELEHADRSKNDDTSDDDDSGETVGDVFNTLTDKQKTAVYAIIGAALDDQGSDDDDDDSNGDAKHSNEGDDFDVKFNVFSARDGKPPKVELTKEQTDEIFHDAVRMGSLRKSVLEHAATYGIDNLEVFFPDAQDVNRGPETIKRRTEWVDAVLSGAKHAPFSRIKSTTIDITEDEARAKGYIKGKKKMEEVIKAAKRETTPTTIYKKQKLDRNDIIDVTTFDMVAYLRNEMRLMLDEELARAALIGDGRSVTSDDKIDEEHIRPIWTDDDLYTIKKTVAENATVSSLIDAIMSAKDDYEGTGNPVLFAPPHTITQFLLLKDNNGRRIYNTEAEVAAAMRVARIIEVPVMTNQVRKVSDTKNMELVGIMVNMTDYTFGTDAGGKVSMFDDFDIDYNQYKYLIETRTSGALTKPHSAIVFEREKTVTPSSKG